MKKQEKIKNKEKNRNEFGKRFMKGLVIAGGILAISEFLGGVE